ncbi:MAG: hypothetical protein Kow0069_15900 [Promethearchaeota archaeon]
MYSASRVFLLFVPGLPQDLYEFAVWGTALLEGKNVYEEFPSSLQGILAIKYPALHFTFDAFVVALFGAASLSFKVGILIVEVPSLLLLKRLHSILTRVGAECLNPRVAKKEEGAMKIDAGKNITILEDEKNKELIVLYAYAFLPANLAAWINGHLFALAALFLIAGLYAFFRGRSFLAGAALSLGFLSEIYPVFALVPILLYLLVRGEVGAFLRVICGFTLGFAACSLPFLVQDPTGYLNGFFVHLARLPKASSLWSFLSGSGIWGYLQVGPVSLSPLGVTFLVVLVGFSIATTVAFVKRNGGPRGEDVLAALSLFYILSPLVFLSLFPRYFFWGMPSYCLLLRGRVGSLVTLERTAVVLTATLFALFISSLLAWPDAVLGDVRLLDPSQIDPPRAGTYFYLMLFIIVAQVIVVLPWVHAAEMIDIPGAPLRLTFVQVLVACSALYVAMVFPLFFLGDEPLSSWLEGIKAVVVFFYAGTMDASCGRKLWNLLGTDAFSADSSEEVLLVA